MSMVHIRLVLHNSCRYKFRGFYVITSYKMKLKRCTHKGCNRSASIVDEF